jgi:hypothetical protein
MHPIILSDFYQCRRSLFQGLVFIALLVFALKYFLGYLGAILALVFLVPAFSFPLYFAGKADGHMVYKSRVWSYGIIDSNCGYLHIRFSGPFPKWRAEI